MTTIDPMTDLTAPRILSRSFVLLAGICAYAGFHAAFLTMVSFLNGGPVPFPANEMAAEAWPLAVAINLGWVALFGIQHAVMARPAFKRVWTRIIPEALERSVFVVATVLCLFAAMIGWQSIPGSVFHVEAEPLRVGLFALQGIGWGTVVLSTFLLDHFELFGLRQVWCFHSGTELPVQKFRQPMLYRYSRHPMMVGMFIGLWATPDMTFDRLLWAAGFSLYIVLGTRLEERDLVDHLGEDYEHYKEVVPRFFGIRRPVAQRLSNALLLSLFASVGFGLAADSASAFVFSVNSTSDAADEAAMDGVCDTGELLAGGTITECTLRAPTEVPAVGGAGSIFVLGSLAASAMWFMRRRRD
ncbi:MAG: isoprenylcysteine carboxylmethyltransferase family protein [Myxococcota bacterium]